MPITVSPPSSDCQQADNSKGFLKKLKSRVDCYLGDIDAVLLHDPAARSKLEVLMVYPGLHALWMHRVSHLLWKKDQKLLSRLLSHSNRFLTGVEIHPGATIGRGVFIDHGMGVVIGETAKIGDGCILFKGAVLGGTQREKAQRHPQLGKNVVIGTNACVLGNIVVGDGARVGSGSVVIRDVPESATVVGVPGRIVKQGDEKERFEAAMDHANLPDPVLEMLREIHKENENLKTRIVHLEQNAHLEDENIENSGLLDPHLATTDLPDLSSKGVG